MAEQSSLPEDVNRRFTASLRPGLIESVHELLESLDVGAQRARNRLHALSGGRKFVMLDGNQGHGEPGWLRDDERLNEHLGAVLATIDAVRPLLKETCASDDCPPEFHILPSFDSICADIGKTVRAVTSEDIADARGHARSLAERSSGMRTLLLVARPTMSEPEALTRNASPWSHSGDFTTVDWFGTEYVFNRTQAPCIELLWEEFDRGEHGLAENTIGEEIGSSADRFRLAHTFRGKDGNHPAWGTMIQRVSAGVYALRRPDHPRTTR